METAREFTRKEIIPVAGQLDETGEFPTEICKKAWETGLMNIEMPEAYGGPRPGLPRPLPRAGGDLVRLRRHQHVDGREHARRDAAPHRRHRGAEEEVPRATARQADLRRLLLLRARRRLRRRRHATARDRKHGDDYVLNGQKRWITNGGVASFYTVFATFDPAHEAQGHRLLRRRRATRPGVKAVGKKRTRWASARSNTTDVIFEDVKVAEERARRRRGRRLQGRDEDVRPLAAVDRGGRRRRHPPLARGEPQLRARAQDVRRADRAAPGDAVHARRDGDRLRGDAPAHATRRRGRSTRATCQHRLELREGLRRRRGDARARPTRCRSSAATATRRSTRSRS